MKALFLACGLLWLFMSCGQENVTDSVALADASEVEAAFVSSVLTSAKLKTLGLAFGPRGSARDEAADITIRFSDSWTSWETAENMETGIPGSLLVLSRTCMVPAAHPSEGKSNITLDDAYKMELVPLRDLAPPSTALKVDGLKADDPAYPLVLVRGIQFDLGRNTGRLKKKADALSRLIMEQLRERGDFFEAKPVLYRIAAGGDAMLARGVQEILFAEGPEGIFGGTAALVRTADLALVNLEGAVTDRGDTAEKTYTFRFDPRVAASLKDAGFDAVLLANNHAFDYGITGFLDSLNHLEQAGLSVLGAGRDIRAAAAPFTASFPAGPGFQVRVFGIASFARERNGWDGLDYAADSNTPGMFHAYAAFNGKRGADMIRGQLQAGQDGLDIVFFHGGIEYADYPDDVTRALYTELIDAGADLIIGTHPHVEQGFEWVHDKPVFWSLGDYVFNGMDDTPGGDKGIFIVLSYLGAKLLYIEVYPVFMNGPRTVISGEDQLNRFYRLTREFAER